MFKAIGGFSHPHQSHINPISTHAVPGRWISNQFQWVIPSHTIKIHYPTTTSCSCHPVIIRSSPIHPATNNGQQPGARASPKDHPWFVPSHKASVGSVDIFRGRSASWRQQRRKFSRPFRSGGQRPQGFSSPQRVTSSPRGGKMTLSSPRDSRKCAGVDVAMDGKIAWKWTFIQFKYCVKGQWPNTMCPETRLMCKIWLWSSTNATSSMYQ